MNTQRYEIEKDNPFVFGFQDVVEMLERPESIYAMLTQMEIYGWKTRDAVASIWNPYDVKHLVPDEFDGEYSSAVYDYITDGTAGEVLALIVELCFVEYEDGEYSKISEYDIEDMLEDRAYC